MTKITFIVCEGAEYPRFKGYEGKYPLQGRKLRYRDENKNPHYYCTGFKEAGEEKDTTEQQTLGGFFTKV